jgi:hypothetical protein
MRDIITKFLKKDVIIKKWYFECEYHQRRMMELCIELDELEYYDEEIWQKVWDTLGHKKRINNIHFLQYFNGMMQRFNSDPKSPFFKKLDDNIAQMKAKHWTPNRQWRYNFDSNEIRPLQELIDRRDEAKIDDQYFSKGGADQSLISRAVEAEKKMKRLRMAKYSVELFDEIVTEMQKEKRTMMEMMAELDVDDEKIIEAQQRITTKRLQAGLSISM